MSENKKTFRGRPLLRTFDPPNTPNIRDFPAWKEILFCGQTNRYAAETLIDVYDAAKAAKLGGLASSIEGMIWLAADDYINFFVPKLWLDQIKPQDVADRAMGYFIAALRSKYRENGELRRDFGHLRNGFFRLLKNRTRDARRIEERIFKLSTGVTTSRAGALKSLTEGERAALRGVDVEWLVLKENKELLQIVVWLLSGDQTWREIGEPLGLSEDAARKRFARMIKRWRDQNDRQRD